jgi:predicted alpha-1,6-mannanase (GH76 family)
MMSKEERSAGTNGRAMRHWIRAGLLALGIVLATGRGGAQSAASYHHRADAAIQSFVLKYWNPSQNYLNASYPSSGRLTGYWTFANGWRAVIDNVERTGNQSYSGLIESLYDGQDSRGWYAGYYDDENWMVLTLMDAYGVTCEPKYLNEAEKLYADIEKGWDMSCCGSSPGGIWWDKAHTQKATASNAGPVISACRLYAVTRKPAYLSFARQVYDYWWSTMVNPTSYQVADHLNTDGSKVWWKFTYNEGLMIGASRELADATHQARYLTNANQIAGFMVKNEVESTRCGPALFDGTNRRCTGDAAQFKGPAFHYLNGLYTASPQSSYYSVLKGSVDAIWNLARNSSLSLFSADWAGPPQASASEMQANAAAIALCDFARTKGEYPGAGIPPNQYEAENATIHSLGLENAHRGFTGWGYVTGWNAKGQGVDFEPRLAAGAHTLTFRYAAGAGDARRLIVINGQNAFPSQRFPGTGSWDRYRTLRVSYRFPAGANRVSVIYDASRESTNSLNLDNMVVH